MATPDTNAIADAARAEGNVVRRDLRQSLLSGIALTIPFFITLLVLLWVLDLVTGMLSPIADTLVAAGILGESSTVLTHAVAAALVFILIFVVGLAAQHGPETKLGARIDTVMEDIPGVGSIYTGVERMSDVLIEGDTESFQEVKLVEFPSEGNYALAFLTADTPAEIEDVADEGDMLTVFVPMAPNPVMGGHLLSLPRDRVYDVDLSVEEGMEAIMTTGMAIDANVDTEAA